MNEKQILTLVDKFSSSSIAELDLNDGTSHLILRKEIAFTSGVANPQAAPLVPGTAEGPVHLAIPVGKVETLSEGEKITSPIVATFYASASPDSPAFVSPGTKVKAGATLCILEAMKMMNHLEAEFDCEIIKTHASSGDLVEYGQALFTVKRL
ncbi:acetyl-CoA carboxylase biotin carboxyl carrier protein [Leadbettera azotonutricia]|uniref:Biotin carboxyl carrier protein of acetyl-CoA carboxylase n=1 Tax=Leadbettera azotonutricia (strain ATCC BAA-888 / DSM 13862 / ZAS-9) TaxID=545695 RepID=F5Y6P5_LEAAZ|nr:acetyl-CoA carboxylase biotin carboxyl carrier protein [Leadbettera azotonutricia]AEF83140.1 acetyl-CoA carboxylase, biotin carboxyl carrier protein [Leadbettera azotonutricia ZAS-9]